MQVQGLSHITFLVQDLERMTRFLCEGLGAVEVYDSKEDTFSVAPEKFFLLGGVWIAAMQGSATRPRDYQHTAFKVDEHDLPQFERRLRDLGVEFQPPRTRVEGEGRSLYFYDFDDHLFELHTGTLDQRLNRYKK